MTDDIMPHIRRLQKMTDLRIGDEVQCDSCLMEAHTPRWFRKTGVVQNIARVHADGARSLVDLVMSDGEVRRNVRGAMLKRTGGARLDALRNPAPGGLSLRR
jgi:hypothetical protein